VWCCGSITYGVYTCALFGEVCRTQESGIPLQTEHTYTLATHVHRMQAAAIVPTYKI